MSTHAGPPSYHSARVDARLNTETIPLAVGGRAVDLSARDSCAAEIASAARGVAVWVFE
jgi:hypothetical protein